MVRIFLALAVLASLLLIGNLVYALALGDFGASSRSYHDKLSQLRQIEASQDVTLDKIERLRQEVQHSAAHVRQQRERFWPHVWLGIIGSLVALLVNSISITYFIGTSRWCREVVEAYGMPSGLAQRSQQLKRRSFPWALLGILTTLVIAGLGAAADPYASTAQPAQWAVWHWSLALVGVLVICVSFWVQTGAVGANYKVIQQILDEAERMRTELRVES